MDASVAVKWIGPEADSDAAMTLVGRSDLVAPDLLIIEVANAVRRKVKEGELTREQAEIGLLRVNQRVELRMSNINTIKRAFDIALAMAHPIYDCVYLTLAESTSSRLVTFGGELGKLAVKHGYGELVSVLPRPGAPG